VCVYVYVCVQLLACADARGRADDDALALAGTLALTNALELEMGSVAVQLRRVEGFVSEVRTGRLLPCCVSLTVRPFVRRTPQNLPTGTTPFCQPSIATYENKSARACSWR
jgi:hypothetical protein